MWQVYLKEMRELLRDKKTLMFVVLLPVLMFPVLFALMGTLMANVTNDAAQKVQRYAIVGGEHAPEFADKIFYHKNFTRIDGLGDDIIALTAAIEEQQIDVAIIIPPKPELSEQSSMAAEFIPHEWQVVFNDSSSLNFMFPRIERLMDKEVAVRRQELVSSLKLTPAQLEELLKPVTLKRVNTADKRESFGEKLGGIIPYLLIPLCFVGASLPAIDLGAGEKERGTLETLLITPMPRYWLVTGKFLVIVSTSMASAIITMVSLLLWSLLLGSLLDLSEISEVTSLISWWDVGVIVLLLLPLSMIFASVLLAISIYARSFKEAQNYMGPVSMMIFMPVVVAMLPGVALTWKTAAIPVTNVALAIKEVLKGTVDYVLLMAIFGFTSVLAVGFILLSTWWFNREDVLFR